MDYSDKGKTILWHGTALSRLRFVSYTAEEFWKLAFNKRKGLNALGPDSVKAVSLREVTVDGVEKRGEVEFTVRREDADVALKIARAAVITLEDLGYRVLAAVVSDTTTDGKKGEHDLLAERRGLSSMSSVEVKCKTIRKPASLLETARGQMRKDAAKLFYPARFAERVVVLVEFAGASLEEGWRMIRVERLDAVGWKSLRGWPGASAVAASSFAVASSGVKRKRESIPASRSSSSSSSRVRSRVASDTKWILLDGRKYVTLPWYLGREAVKSQKQMANKRAFSARVEMRNGDWNTLANHWGKELLDAGALPRFRQHHWVQANCGVSRSGSLEVRLLSGQQQPDTKKFLWKLEELERCKIRQ